MFIPGGPLGVGSNVCFCGALLLQDCRQISQCSSSACQARWEQKVVNFFYLSGKFKKNALEKNLCFCSCYFIDRGASKPASSVDAGGGALVDLPPLHGGGGAGALPLHPLLPPRHAQICCWHLPPPPSAPWHPCSENWSQVKDLVASNWNKDNAICSNSSLIA